MDTPESAVVPLDTPGLLRSLYRDVLAPSFPPAELVDERTFLAGHDAGRLRSLGVVRDGRVVAGVVGQWFPDARVLLVQYLAIAPGARGCGIGSRLVTAAVASWRALEPLLVVAEVEHPDHHTGSEAHGDPVARLRFYARLGARVLALPYFQPGGGPGGERVPALLLMSLPLDAATGASGASRRWGGSGDVPASPVRTFLEANLRSSEGVLAHDAATRRLLDAARGDRVALVDPADPDALATVPTGLLAPHETHAPRP